MMMITIIIIIIIIIIIFSFYYYAYDCLKFLLDLTSASGFILDPANDPAARAEVYELLGAKWW